MAHLASEELIDLADGTRPESSAPHLQACEVCRRQLADLRTTMASVAKVDVPEPSPLFWDHFSARVSEAVAAEGEPRRTAWFATWSRWTQWSTSRLTVPMSIAALAALVIVASLTFRVGSLPAVDAPAPAVGSVVANEELAWPPDDPALELMADLTEDLDWDAAHDAGFITHRSEIDTAIRQLTSAERQELQRLLKAEMARSSN